MTRKKNVGIVELPNSARHIYNGFDQAANWDIKFIVSSSADDWVANFAWMRAIPLLNQLDQERMAECDRLVVGELLPENRAQVEAAAAAGNLEIVSIEHALTAYGEAPGVREDESSVASEAGAPGEEFPSHISDDESASDELAVVDLPAGAMTPFSQPDPAEQDKPFAPAEHVGSEDPGTREFSQASPPPVPQPDPATPTAPPAAADDPIPVPAPAPSSDSESGPDYGRQFLQALRVFQGDGSRPEFAQILSRVIKTTRAASTSIMVPDKEADHLRILASEGLPGQVSSQSRRRMSGSSAGKAFLTGKPVFTQVEVPPYAEEDHAPIQRTSASVPVMCYSRPLGVLNVTIESEEAVDPSTLIDPLNGFASEIECALLRAFDVSGMDTETRGDVLLLQVDRLMALGESLAVRLRMVSETLCSAFGGDYAHFYLTDVLGEKLQLMSPPRGMGALSNRFQSTHEGILGWIAASGHPQVLPATNMKSNETRGILCVPLTANEKLYGLFVVENIRLDSISAEDVRDLVDQVIGILASMVEVEEGMGVQDFLSELRVRIADMVPFIEAQPPSFRVNAALQATSEILAAETAVWFPGGGENPVLGNPSTPDTFKLLSGAWQYIDKIAEATREQGRVSWHPVRDWGDSGVPCTAPYLGVKSDENDGVLLVFFSPDDNHGPTAQLPPGTLQEVLSCIVQRIDPLESPQEGQAASKVVITDPVRPESKDTFMGHLHQEWIRSMRFGHYFSLTRFRIESDGPTSSEDSDLLRSFLIKQRRGVDILTELRPGVFMILSPETDRSPDGIRFRLSMSWNEQHPQIPMGVDQRIFPNDGEAEEIYIGWIEEAASLDAAA